MVGGRRLLAHDSKPEVTRTTLRIGQEMTVPGIDWKASPQSLVMVLSTTCRYCLESAPFYRELLRHQGRGWRVLAVFPQAEEQARAYLSEQGYRVDEVRQLQLGALGVFSTPQLLLVNASGRLQQQWIGRLPPTDEKDVAEHLGIRDLAVTSTGNSPDSASVLVGRSELVELLGKNTPLTIVDIRERYRYDYGHVSRAVNIPHDELYIRLPHEVPQDEPILLYCNYSAACEANGTPSRCSFALDELRRLGAPPVRVIRDPLPLLSAGGIAVSGVADEPQVGTQ